MKKIMAAALALTLISPVASFAKSDSDCNAYVKSTSVEGGKYRFHIVNGAGMNINNSNDWSFAADSRDVAEVLNLAYLFKVPVCINYTYRAGSWDITYVSIQ
ncbi:hypothetical protein AAIB78_001666 [Morganella morganii]